MRKVIQSVTDMSVQEMIDFINKRLNHNSTRRADRPYLLDCYMSLTSGNKLDSTQEKFLDDLVKEYKARNKQYSAAAREKRKGKIRDTQVKVVQTMEEKAKQHRLDLLEQERMKTLISKE